MNPLQPERGIVVIGDAQIAMVADGPIGKATTFRRSESGDALLTAIVVALLWSPTDGVDSAKMGSDYSKDGYMPSLGTFTGRTLAKRSRLLASRTPRRPP